MSITWDESFAIGDRDIDAQHKYLFRLANQFLLAKTQVDQTECARQLLEYTEKHFSYEESLMREVGFPWYEAHVEAHQRLIARLEALNQQILQGRVDAQGLENFVRHWALFHIPKEDAALAEYLNSGETQEGDLRPE